jgi:hypothetical protein
MSFHACFRPVASTTREAYKKVGSFASHWKQEDFEAETEMHRKKKVREFPVPCRDFTTKLSLGGNNDVITELFLPRGSLVSDIPAGDGKLVNLFYGVANESICRYWILDSTLNALFICKVYSLAGFK